MKQIRRNRLTLGLYLAVWTLMVLPSIFFWARFGLQGFIDQEFQFLFGQIDWPKFLTQNPLTNPEKLGHFLGFALLSLLFYRLWRMVEGKKSAGPQIKELWMWTIGATLIAYLGIPWVSPDITYYLAKGWMHSHLGLNPWEYLIEDVPGYTAEPMFSNVYHMWTKSRGNYGPLFHALAYIVTWMGHGNPLVTIFIYKAVAAFAHLTCCWLLTKLMPYCALRKSQMLIFYGLNPLVLFNFVTAGHNDVFSIVFVLFAFLLLHRKAPFLSGLAFGIALGIKFSFLITLPAFGLFALRRDFRDVINFSLKWGLGFLGATCGAFLLEPGALQNLLHNTTVGFPGYRSSVYLIIYPIANTLLGAEFGSIRPWMLALFIFTMSFFLIWRLVRHGKTRPQRELYICVFFILLAYLTLVIRQVTEWYIILLFPVALLSGYQSCQRYVLALSVLYMPLVIFSLHTGVNWVMIISQITLYLIMIVPFYLNFIPRK